MCKTEGINKFDLSTAHGNVFIKNRGEQHSELQCLHQKFPVQNLIHAIPRNCESKLQTKIFY